MSPVNGRPNLLRCLSNSSLGEPTAICERPLYGNEFISVIVIGYLNGNNASKKKVIKGTSRIQKNV